jgi:hypothetical protein
MHPFPSQSCWLLQYMHIAHVIHSGGVKYVLCMERHKTGICIRRHRPKVDVETSPTSQPGLLLARNLRHLLTSDQRIRRMPADGEVGWRTPTAYFHAVRLSHPGNRCKPSFLGLCSMVVGLCHRMLYKQNPQSTIAYPI